MCNLTILLGFLCLIFGGVSRVTTAPASGISQLKPNTALDPNSQPTTTNHTEATLATSTESTSTEISTTEHVTTGTETTETGSTGETSTATTPTGTGSTGSSGTSEQTTSGSPITGSSTSSESSTVTGTTITTSGSPITGSSEGSTTNPMTSATSMSPTKGPTTLAPAKRRFDAGSFVGGIALGAGVFVISLIAYKCYVSRKQKQQYKAM